MISELDKLILQKIITSDTHLSGVFLSQLCNVSVNTIRKEIDIINDFLVDQGCLIETKIAAGYNFVITDPDLANPFISDFLRDITRYKYLNLSESSKTYYIVRRLLTTSKYITIETLMDELYCSKSTILRNLALVKNVLEYFHLELKTKRNYGLYLEGSEWNKRICLIYQHKIFIHDLDPNRQKEEFFKATFLQDIDYALVRKVLISSLSNFPDIAISNVDFAKVINYIILNKTRANYSSSFTFTREQIDTAKSLRTYSLSLKIYENLPEYFKESLKDIDILTLSMVLASCRTIYSSEQIEESEKISCLNDANEIIAYVHKRYCVDQMFNEAFFHDFVCYLYSLKIRLLFQIPTDQEMSSSAIQRGLLTADICATFADYYTKKYSVSLKESDIIGAYYILNRTIVENEMFFEKKKGLILSRYGIYYAKNVAARIEINKHYYFEEILPIEFTDLFSINLNDYDLLISDLQADYLKVDLPIVNVAYNRNPKDFMEMNDFFNQIFKKYALQYFTKDNLHKKNFQTKDDIFNYFYSLHKNYFKSKQAFLDEVQLREQYITFERVSGIILITTLTTKFDKPVIDVVINRKPILWNSQRSSVFIFYQQGQGTAKDLQVNSYILKQFIHKPESYVNMLNSIEYEEIIKKFIATK